MDKIYHLCLKESEVPQSYNSHNKVLEQVGAIVSLKWRRGPFVDYRDCYLVFWYENGTVYFSRINIARHGLDAFFFKDGHEMVECRNWEEFTEKMKEFKENGYVIN